MSQNVFLILLFPCVIVGLAGGMWGGLWVSGHLPDSMPEVARGIATLLITFLCCAAGIAVMYGFAYQIDKFMRRRKKAGKGERKTYHQERTAKKRRKKR
jgi:heme O synthase-like polyprenyltransferase